MKALNITSVGKVALVEMEKPTLKYGEVLLKIRYVGFCGSDLNTFLGKNPMVVMPVIPGHEISAVIEEKGEGVPEDIKIGMNCTVNPYTSCGSCPSCLNS